jgi:hypothetical protein
MALVTLGEVFLKSVVTGVITEREIAWVTASKAPLEGMRRPSRSGSDA